MQTAPAAGPQGVHFPSGLPLGGLSVLSSCLHLPPRQRDGVAQSGVVAELPHAQQARHLPGHARVERGRQQGGGVAAEGDEGEAVAGPLLRKIGEHLLRHRKAGSGFAVPLQIVQAHGQRSVEQHHDVAALGRGGDPRPETLRLRERDDERRQRQRAQRRSQPGVADSPWLLQHAVQIGVQQLRRLRGKRFVPAPCREQGQQRQRQGEKSQGLRPVQRGE
ncbi:hypothetical protein GALL_461790 [mine drainage metagenome]|uniref:Uncharacterized protein n=1 Tax=mine drainage metagenome TaxID=410659 RepID=A0A1J5PXA3_9ZZZZ